MWKATTPPIVPKEVYLRVQGEILRRSVLKHDPVKCRCSSDIVLCGRLVCGRCGKTLKRYTRPEKNQVDWRCHNRAYPVKSNHQARKSACGCRFVTEEEVKSAVLTTLNKLPSYRDDLLRIDRECSHRLREIDIALSSSLPSDPAREQLLLERADLAANEHPVRMLLELIEVTSGKHTPPNKPLPASCSDPEDFYLRTRYLPPENILGENGSFIKFDKNLVVRYFDTFTVLDDGLDLHMKAGLSFFIPAEIASLHLL